MNADENNLIYHVVEFSHATTLLRRPFLADGSLRRVSAGPVRHGRLFRRMTTSGFGLASLQFPGNPQIVTLSRRAAAMSTDVRKATVKVIFVRSSRRIKRCDRLGFAEVGEQACRRLMGGIK